MRTGDQGVVEGVVRRLADEVNNPQRPHIPLARRRVAGVHAEAHALDLAALPQVAQAGEEAALGPEPGEQRLVQRRAPVPQTGAVGGGHVGVAEAVGTDGGEGPE